MARRFLVLVLFVTAIAGFGSVARWSFRHRHEAFERHVADICTDAALRAAAKPHATAP